MGDDDDGVAVLEGGDEFLDLEGGEGVEGGAGLVHEQDFGAVGDGAGDAEALLLAAGKAEGAVVEAVFHLVPKRGVNEGALDGFIELTFAVAARNAEAEDDIFVDRLRERIVFLEDHADAFAQGNDLDGGIVEADAVEADVALVADAVDEVVHAVHVPQQGGFPATRRADECGDLVLRDRHVDAEDRLFLTVVETEVLDADEIRAGGFLGWGHGDFFNREWTLIFANEEGFG